MTGQQKSRLEILVEELDRELIGRAAQMPGEAALQWHDGEAPRRGTP